MTTNIALEDSPVAAPATELIALGARLTAIRQELACLAFAPDRVVALGVEAAELNARRNTLLQLKSHQDPAR